MEPATIIILILAVIIGIMAGHIRTQRRMVAAAWKILDEAEEKNAIASQLVQRLEAREYVTWHEATHKFHQWARGRKFAPWTDDESWTISRVIGWLSERYHLTRRKPTEADYTAPGINSYKES